MKNKNTPERIVTRAEGATFYCADCLKTYQQCKCKVYRSVDTLKEGKSDMFRRSAGRSERIEALLKKLQRIKPAQSNPGCVA